MASPPSIPLKSGPESDYLLASCAGEALLVGSALVLGAVLSWGMAQQAGQPPPSGRGGPQPPLPVSIPKAIFADADPVRSCESLRSVVLPDTTIDAAAVEPGDERTSPSCRVTATVTHPPAGDRIKVFVGLPLKGWNGRFQGVGGGGFSGGSANGVRAAARRRVRRRRDRHRSRGRERQLRARRKRPVELACHSRQCLPRHPRDDRHREGADRGSSTARRRATAYFNGCSTGGRQGLSEAQRFPDDYHGILSGAPAINWPKLHVEQLWGHLVMLEAKNFVPQCKFEAATAAAIEACDTIDASQRRRARGSAPLQVRSEGARRDGAERMWSDHATRTPSVIRRIWEGPKRQRRIVPLVWSSTRSGLRAERHRRHAIDRRGPSPSRSTGSATSSRRIRSGTGRRSRRHRTSSCGTSPWSSSARCSAPTIPNLSAFKRSRREVDPLARLGRSIDLRRGHDRLLHARPAGDGRAAKNGDVHPAVHGARRRPLQRRHGSCTRQSVRCVGRLGRAGRAPETLSAVRRDESGKVVRSRPLCAYPLVARYKGQGSTDEASSFECKANF